MPRRADLEADRVELLEAEAELELISLDHLAGRLPADARRALLDHELDAGVNFAELEDTVDARAQAVAGRLAADRRRFVELMARDLQDTVAQAAVDADRAVATRLADLLDPSRVANPIAGVAELVAEAEQFHAAELAGAVQDGVARAVAEARTQGIPAPHLPTLPDAATTRVDTLARRLATSPHADVLNTASHAADRVAGVGLGGAQVIAETVEASSTMSTATLESTYARPAVQSAHNLGHQEAAATVPAVARIYASELLDRNTCGPCSLIDGHEYDSEAQALADYPTGTYVDCEGGDRCRGTLVYVWSSEAPPSLPAPPPDTPPYPFGTSRPTGLPPGPPPTAPPAPAVIDQDPHATPAAPGEGTPLPPLELPDEPVEGAFTAAELAAARRDIPRARLEVRELARQNRADVVATLERFDALKIARPPALKQVRNVVTRRLEWRQEQEGWDWFYSLSQKEQKRLRREWMSDEAGALSPDELAQHWNNRMGTELTDEEASRAWLDLTRQADGNGWLARGRLIDPESYGGLEADALVDSPYQLRRLFGDTEGAAEHLAGVAADLNQALAERSFIPARLGPAPYNMTRAEFVDEVTTLEARLQNTYPIREDEFERVFAPEDQHAVDRYAELVPEDLDPELLLGPDELHDAIIDLARKAGLL